MGTYTAAGHATMTCLDDDSDPMGLEIVPDTVRNLSGKALLDLEAPSISVQNTGQFGYAYDPVLGKVGYRGGSRDWRKMMLTVGLERNVTQEDYFIISSYLIERARKIGGWIDLISVAIFFPCTRHARRRISKAFTIRIVARPSQKRSDSIVNFLGS